MDARSIDYDEVVGVYDRRYREGGPSGVAEHLGRWVSEVRPANRAPDVLEVGCGTGHWLATLSADARITGIDLSEGMLAGARAKLPAGALCRADAHRLPFRSRSFDLICIVNALHHMQEPERVIRGCVRLLRPGGALTTVGMDPRAGTDRWYLYEFFPGTSDADAERYWPGDRIEAWMREAGCAEVERGVAARIERSARGRGVLDDPVLDKHGTSQLALLTDEEFAKGMERIRAAFEGDPGRVFAIDVSLHAVVGRAPA